MAWRVAAAAPLLLGQLSLFPLRLSGVGAQADQGFELQQPQDKVSVAAGETLTLTCITSGDSPPGPVRWLKGWGSENETIYGPGVSFPRVTSAVNGSNTDFSIRIRDVHPGDSGTYYCVKFRRSLGGEELFQHGKGTEVSVTVSALLPSMAAAAGLLCFLLLLGLLGALCMYRRKRRGRAEGQGLAGPAATGGFSPVPLRCCAGTPSTPSSKVLDAETSPLPRQQSTKEDNDIHYADLQPLPAGAWPGPSPGTGCSEYASVRVAAQ
ncbi:signal-regulatory protein beta-1-like [Colius striatus]|uniref:signal-regulatory protein beta-1-like n=1 Tax=Colius striatus TaxID=57412 RepID=UPI002B1CE7CC|nr:signal-regulatory protein beta-1-like [Colius striatus]